MDNTEMVLRSKIKNEIIIIIIIIIIITKVPLPVLLISVHCRGITLDFFEKVSVA